MIKAIFIQRASGTCIFFRLFDDKLKEEKDLSVLEGYFSAITTTVSEFGDIAPTKILFNNNDAIVYENLSNYILGILVNNSDSNRKISPIKNAFKSIFMPLSSSQSRIIENELLSENDEEHAQKEKKAIQNFSRVLNLFVKKHDIKHYDEKALSEASEPLLMSDVDLLLASPTGQPIYMMLSLSLLYEPTIFLSFISAIQELGKNLGLGLINQIEGENLIIFIETLENVLGVLITHKTRYMSPFRRFLSFASLVCQNWLQKYNIKPECVGELFNRRTEIESMIKLLVDSDAWEIHQIKEKERDLLASKVFDPLL